MVSRVVWAKRAMEDLHALHDFIARDSPQYAQAQVRAIQAAAYQAQKLPRIGRILPEFPTEKWREILCGSYRIIYRYDAKKRVVRILAVVHQSRMLRLFMIE